MVAVFVLSLLAQVGAAIGGPVTVPPPLPQATADCARPVYASDHLVCADAELLAMDRRLAAALHNRHHDDQPLLEGDESWLRRRSRCAFEADHRQCLTAAYANRMAVVEALARAPVTAIAAQCTGSLPMPHVNVEFSGDGNSLIVRNAGSGAALGAATAPPAFAGWNPFATFSRKGRQVHIRTEAGGEWRCTVSLR